MKVLRQLLRYVHALKTIMGCCITRLNGSISEIEKLYDKKLSIYSARLIKISIAKIPIFLSVQFHKLLHVTSYHIKPVK